MKYQIRENGNDDSLYFDRGSGSSLWWAPKEVAKTFSRAEAQDILSDLVAKYPDAYIVTASG